MEEEEEEREEAKQQQQPCQQSCSNDDMEVLSGALLDDEMTINVDMLDLMTSLGMFETLPVLDLADEECLALLKIGSPSTDNGQMSVTEEEEVFFDSDCTLEEVKPWG